MKLRQNAIKDLQEIMQRDYGIALSESEASILGSSLLRLSMVARIALNREEERIDNQVMRSGQRVSEKIKPAGQQGVLLSPVTTDKPSGLVPGVRRTS